MRSILSPSPSTLIRQTELINHRTLSPEATWSLRTLVSVVFRAVTEQSIRVSKQTETHPLSQACSGQLLVRLIHAAGQQRGRGQRRADSGQTTQGGPSTLFFHLGHRAAPTGRPRGCLMRGSGRLPQAARPGRAAGIPGLGWPLEGRVPKHRQQQRGTLSHLGGGGRGGGEQ